MTPGASALGALGVARGAGGQWPVSRTGSWIRPFSTAAATTAAAAASIGPAPSGPGRVVVVVDPHDDVVFARSVGTACRGAGRFVVHTGPYQRGVARIQREVLGALGKAQRR